MKIDSKTLLFSDFTDNEAREMESWARSVLLGPVPPLHEEAWPVWLKQWFEVAGYDSRQSLMVISTVVPARILLSLLDRQHLSLFTESISQVLDQNTMKDFGFFILNNFTPDKLSEIYSEILKTEMEGTVETVSSLDLSEDDLDLLSQAIRFDFKARSLLAGREAIQTQTLAGFCVFLLFNFAFGLIQFDKQKISRIIGFYRNYSLDALAYAQLIKEETTHE